VIHHFSVIPLVKAILGEGCLCSGLSFLRRESCLVNPPEDIDGDDPLALERRWHREDSGNIEGADWNNYFAPAIQVIYYLDDVDETTHCTSVIPESAATKRSLPKTSEGDLRIDDHETSYVDPDKPRWVDSFGRDNPRRIGGVDVHAGSGSAIVFNNASFHCGTIRKTDRIRRTVHVRYRQPEPVRSRHAMSTYSRQVGHTIADFQAALPKRTSIRTI
jgi:ectoine hydroxylase-related dioxygenase (phytanoyl-CoA dioxygenase family)